MVYFKRHILCATPLTPVCLQSFYKTITPIILKNSCYYIRISAFYFSVPAEPIIVKQLLHALDFRLSNTFSGLLIMPHAPFLFMNWLTSCLPSPCRRLSRPRTTTEAPLPCRIFSVIFLGFLPLEIYRLAALRIAG